jgi:molecular chaperone DnaK
MVSDAETHADEDARAKETVETRNMADSLVYQSEKTIKDLGDKVPDDIKGEVESAVAELKTALEGEDLDEIKTKTEALTQAGYKLGEIAYKQAQEESASAAGTGDAANEGNSGEGDEEVVDGDFEVVDGDE